jgi:SAM-dependent methyltransferase
VAAGSFFEAVPHGADAYLLKSVLHNWDDERAVAILRTCAAAMRPGARIVLFERIVPERLTASPGDQDVARSDLNMLVGCGGRERTAAQFRELLGKAEPHAGSGASAVRGLQRAFGILKGRKKCGTILEMSNKPFAYSIGALDSFEIKANELACSGWILSLEPGGSERLEVAIEGVAIAAEIRHPLPSADVHAVWPALAGSAQCRFEIRARLSAQQLAQVVERKGLVSVALTSPGGVPGLPLVRPWPISLEKAPPALSDRVGHGDFIETAFSFLSIFRKVAGLGRDEQVLDAGCGLGRMAFGLAHYLGPKARYEGFDISPDLTAMAQEAVRAAGELPLPARGRLQPHVQRARQAEGLRVRVPVRERGVLVRVPHVRLHAHVPRRRAALPRRDPARAAAVGAMPRDVLRHGRGGAGKRPRRPAALAFTHEPDRGCHVHDPAAPENAVAYDEDVLLSMIAKGRAEGPGSPPRAVGRAARSSSPTRTSSCSVSIELRTVG